MSALTRWPTDPACSAVSLHGAVGGDDGELHRVGPLHVEVDELLGDAALGEPEFKPLGLLSPVRSLSAPELAPPEMTDTWPGTP